MIGLHLVQATIVAALKDDETLVELVGVEIRELQWQGTEFAFPAVRVRMGIALPTGEKCIGSHSVMPFRVVVFSEESSSLQCDQIAAQVVEVLYLGTLTGATFHSGLIRLSGGLGPAVWVDSLVWRAEIGFETFIYEG